MDLPVSPAAALAAFSDTTRLYALEGNAAFAPLHVERWHGQEALSACFAWTIDTVASDAGLPLDAMLGQPLTLRATLADGSDTRRTGLVREAQLVGSNGGLARYRLTVVPWLWVLSQGRHSRVFEDKTVLDIAEAIFADYAALAAWTITPDARQLIAQVRPRSYAVQYRETDLAFVERLLAEEGLGYTFVEDAKAPAGHSLTLFADSAELPEDVTSASDLLGQGIRFQRAGSTEQNDTIQRIGLARHLVPAQLTTLSHDYKSMAAVATSATLPSTAEVGRENYDPAGPYAYADSREAEHYAVLAAQAWEVQQHDWEGRGTVRTARAGTRFRLAQAYLDTQGVPEELVFTRVVSAGINNLPDAVREAADASLEPTAEDPDVTALWPRAQAVGYAMHFAALKRTQPFRPALTDEHGVRLNPRPTVPGPQTALVVGPEGETTPGTTGPLYTDKLGRLKVKFHWMTDGASCWLRCVQRYAGQGHGAQFLPRIGQEVMVGFLRDDIDRPVILGALYDGQGEAGIAPTPGNASSAADGQLYTQAGDFNPSAQGNVAGGNSPAWHGQSNGDAGHANAAALSGVKTQGFDGNGHNQLVFDDTDRQGRVQFATTQAATQINLGHLIHQADNYRGSFRGTGFEVRSDAWGAVRGTRGVLLSTYAQADTEPAADATAAASLVKQHGQLAQSLNGAAKTHKTMPLAGVMGVTGANQSALSTKAAPLPALYQSLIGTVTGEAFAKAQDGGTIPHSKDALTTLTARAGSGTLAGQSLHLAAGQTLNLASGHDTNLAIAGQLRIHANQGIGLVAGAEGAKGTGLHVIAGQGALDVQAQHDAMQLRSKGDLNVVSANAAAEFAAKKVVHLATKGGAFITLEGGNITFGAPGKLTVKAGQHKLVGGTHLSREMNSWGDPNFNDKFQVHYPDGTPAKNRAYELTRSDGAKIRGTTDDSGLIQLQSGVGPDGLSIRFLNEDAQGDA